MLLTIKGKHQTVSKPAVRAWFQASASVLAYHNMPVQEVSVRILPMDHPILNCPQRLANGGDKWSGWCNWGTTPMTIVINDEYNLDNLGTVILHEMIHAGCTTFGSEYEHVSLEKCTSTLTAKLKPTVSALAQILLDNTYRNAAHVAHTRKGMAYRTKDDNSESDFYDDQQWVKTNPEDPYKKN
jgi:hypothetical protein